MKNKTSRTNSMKLKKVIAASLAVFILFAFTGCKTSSGSATTESSKQEDTSTTDSSSSGDLNEKLNDLYHTFESLPLDLQEDYGELMCYFTSLDELHQHRHDVIHYSWCKNMADVARHLLDNDPAFSAIEERLTRYFDYDAYGQYLDDNGKFIETDHGIYELP